MFGLEMIIVKLLLSPNSQQTALVCPLCVQLCSEFLSKEFKIDLKKVCPSLFLKFQTFFG